MLGHLLADSIGTTVNKVIKIAHIGVDLWTNENARIQGGGPGGQDPPFSGAQHNYYW
jgi:hypothetical protein